jgi:TolA-binding protein
VKRLLLAALVLATCSAAPAGEGDAWWNPGWSVRRTFECTGTRSDLAGEEVGVAEFLTGGLAAADGRDVRVLPAGSSKPLPVRVLSAGPGDFLRVCFPLVKEVTGYHVYYGNPAAKAGESFEPKRGLLMEVRPYRGGQPDNLKGMQEIIKKAGPLQGSDFVDRVFFGHNPFGPRDNYVAVYTGWLKCPADGDYVFATSSDDASFLLLDGKLVIGWPGWHGAVADIRHKGKVALDAGLHKLEYLHVNGEGDGTAVAAWQPPGEEKVAVIPAEAFAKVSRGRQTAYALKDQPAPPDFATGSLGEAYLDTDVYLVRAGFAARLGAEEPPAGAKLTWDFGDGQAGKGAAVSHVYVLPGMYKVTLQAEVAGRKLECANTVRVDRDMARAVAGKSERLTDYAAMVAGYDLARLSPTGLKALAALYKETEQGEEQLAVARAVLARPPGQFADQDYWDQLLLAVHALRELKRGDEGRAEAFRWLDAAEKHFQDAKRNNFRAQVIRERGDIYYFYANDLEKAYNEYDKVVSRFRGLEDNIVRVTKIRLGDIHRERGNYEEAEKRYREAEALKLFRQKPQAEDPRRGALAHVAESYLKTREFAECERAIGIWEWEYPLEKLTGYSTLLTCQLAFLQKKPEEVVKQAETLLGVSPKSNFAGELLLLEAQAQRALGKPDKATECLKRIIEKYPECEQVGKARELLDKGEPKGPPKPPGGK